MPGISDNQQLDDTTPPQSVQESEQVEQRENMEIQEDDQEQIAAASISQNDKINKNLLNAFLERINKGEINQFQQVASNENSDFDNPEEQSKE